MENRDQDEMSENTPSDIARDKSEEWDSEPGRSSGASELEDEGGRSGGDVSSDEESDSDLGSDRGFGESGNVNRRSSIEREH